jgi:zinc transport system substrate-binding protein
MRFYFLLFFVMFSFNAFAQKNHKIQASIRPLQSIISNLTKNIEEVGLIMDQNESLHNYYLRPSKTRMIHSSEMIILINKDFETFLKNTIGTLDTKKIKIIEVSKFPEIDLLEDVEGHCLGHGHEVEHKHKHEHEQDKHQHNVEGHKNNHVDLYDYHIWLDPIRVKSIAKAIVEKFVEEDPKNQITYINNLNDFLIKLDELNENIKLKMQQIRDVNFVVTHNAYQYFIDRYKLSTPRAITIDHDHNIGIREFLKIQSDIKENKVQCIFEEPQFKSKIIEKIKANTDVRVSMLDAEWGPDNVSVENQYFVMMNQLSDSFYNCLK